MAIVNETVARRFWPQENPIGSRVYVAPPESLVADLIASAIAAGQPPAAFTGFPRLTIVGIVRDVRERGLEGDVAPTVYVPYAQAAPPNEEPNGSFFLAVRTSTDPLAYRRAIEAVVHRLNPNLPLADVRAMDARVAESLWRRRFAMLLLGAFAGVALILVIAGLYGVMSYLVTRRRIWSSTGTRSSAAGSARPGPVAGLHATGIGVAVGLLLAAVLARFIEGQLFEVKPLDPGIYGATALGMAIVAAIACRLPALRAARLDPATTLRQE